MTCCSWSINDQPLKLTGFTYGRFWVRAVREERGREKIHPAQCWLWSNGSIISQLVGLSHLSSTYLHGLVGHKSHSVEQWVDVGWGSYESVEWMLLMSEKSFLRIPLISRRAMIFALFSSSVPGSNKNEFLSSMYKSVTYAACKLKITGSERVASCRRYSWI